MAVLSFAEPTIYERSKCFFSLGTMAHLDPTQLPKTQKAKPWTAMLAQGFVHRVDLIVPEDHWQAVQESLVKGGAPTDFCRVTMTLGQILQGDFFTEYIKIGDIMMLSQGRITMDNVFTLKDGQLTMFLDKESYERAGLVGKPLGVKGSRGLKPQWIVQFDLRSPSMFRGKKGFDRLIYACTNALTEPLNWLFSNVSGKTPTPDPLQAFQPTQHTCDPQVAMMTDVASPYLRPPSYVLGDHDRQATEEFAADVYEWLALVRLQSPRVLSTDTIDPYLSRYRVPGEPNTQVASKLCKITWEGLLPPSFTCQVLSTAILALPSRAWLCLSSSSFPTNFYGETTECVFLRPPSSPGEYMLWEVKPHE